MLKLLSETDEGIAVLAKMKLVLFGGSPCPDELGDKLVAAGVPLTGHYGLSKYINKVSNVALSDGALLSSGDGATHDLFP